MNLFDYPIYSELYFGKLKKTQGICPAKTDICNNFPSNFYVIDGTVSLPKCNVATFSFTNNKDESQVVVVLLIHQMTLVILC